MHRPKTGATHNHAVSRLSYKGCAIKGWLSVGRMTIKSCMDGIEWTPREIYFWVMVSSLIIKECKSRDRNFNLKRFSPKMVHLGVSNYNVVLLCQSSDINMQICTKIPKKVDLVQLEVLNRGCAINVLV